MHNEIMNDHEWSAASPIASGKVREGPDESIASRDYATADALFQLSLVARRHAHCYELPSQRIRGWDVLMVAKKRARPERSSKVTRARNEASEGEVQRQPPRSSKSDPAAEREPARTIGEAVLSLLTAASASP